MAASLNLPRAVMMELYSRGLIQTSTQLSVRCSLIYELRCLPAQCRAAQLRNHDGLFGEGRTN